MTRRSNIYALLEPTTYQPKYVGRTGSSLPRRLGQHLADSKLAEPTRLAAWLRELATAGQRPIIALLDSVPDADWRQAERDWIARLRAEGAMLVNTDEGGTGPQGGYRWSEESVEKMRRSKAGRSLGGSSVYPGVSRHAATGRWRAQLCNANLGHHDTEDAAFCTYLAAYRERFGGDPLGWEGWKPADPLAEIGGAKPTPKLA